MQDKLVNEHIILGVDPGTLFMGYAILRTRGKQTDIVCFDVLLVVPLSSSVLVLFDTLSQ